MDPVMAFVLGAAFGAMLTGLVVTMTALAIGRDDKGDR